jgi:hypothetical protein
MTRWRAMPKMRASPRKNMKTALALKFRRVKHESERPILEEFSTWSKTHRYSAVHRRKLFGSSRSNPL